MSSISLEAFDENLRGKVTQWILPSDAPCLPEGFQDQILSNIPAFQTTILLTTKTSSRGWLIAYTWDMSFIPESNTDWSLLLSILAHMKKPILIVTTPECIAPQAFWNKCNTMTPPPTSVILTSTDSTQQCLPHSIFFPKLNAISEEQFMKIPAALDSSIQQSIKHLDLRSLYRELRGAGASLCLSFIYSRTVSNPIPSYTTTWFYPEINGALRLNLSDLRMILRTITERLA